MSPDPFVHLHVASGYSLQYGASHPHVLVERELWRVEAGRGSGATGSERSGVFDLSFSWTDGSWQLVGCAD